MPRIHELHLATGLALLLTFTGLSLAPDLITVARAQEAAAADPAGADCGEITGMFLPSSLLEAMNQRCASAA